jgi:hypothetical protein
VDQIGFTCLGSPCAPDRSPASGLERRGLNQTGFIISIAFKAGSGRGVALFFVGIGFPLC